MDQVLTQLIPELVEKGVFGKGKFVSLTLDEDANMAYQKGSVIELLNLTILKNEGTSKTLPIVIKVPETNEIIRRVRNMSNMFWNEVTMYKEVLPVLNPNTEKPYPTYYYGFSSGRDFQNEVLILGNMTSQGYMLCKEKLFLDFHHIALAMERIGELHSWSYTMKSKNPSQFHEIKNKLREVIQESNDELDYEISNYLWMKKGIDPFMKDNNESDLLKAFLKIVENLSVVKNLISKPEEPFGVIIHGDYCKNNIFYQYNSSGKPVNCAYFDLQLSQYGSPVIDLSFFLYLHTTAEMREKHWDDFLNIYWKSVRKNVPDDINLPTFEDFLVHFSTKAVYGYFPCSFFLPTLLGGEYDVLDKYRNAPREVRLQKYLENGGEIGLKKIMEVVSHLLEKKYIHQFVEYYNNIKYKY